MVGGVCICGADGVSLKPAVGVGTGEHGSLEPGDPALVAQAEGFVDARRLGHGVPQRSR